MFERNAFKDYYDVYALVKEGILTVDKLIESSISYHSRLKRQMIINRLLRWEQFDEDPGFVQLSPKYHISKREIGNFFAKLLSAT